MEFHLLVRGGTVIDGTGAAAQRADVGVTDGRIAAVGDLSSATAVVIVDAGGKAVTPGYIDVHAHTDVTPALLERHPEVALAGIRQGVTTEVCGNCGFTVFPTSPQRAEGFARHTALFGTRIPPFADLDAYQAHLEQFPMVPNMAPLVGHGSIRAGVMGFDQRPPTPEELAEMERAADVAFEQGAFGLSSGLIYPPGIFGDTDEVAALAKPGARRGRVYTTHMRNEGDRVIDAIDEALGIGRLAGIPVQISHHKVSGRGNWGRSSETLAHIDTARSQGVDVTCDVYPYTAGSTNLSAVLPPWVHDGGPDAMVARLQSPAERKRIAADIETGLPEWEDFVRPNGWESIVIASSPRRPEAEGRSVAELADASGKSPTDEAADLLIEHKGQVLMVVHSMQEDDVRAILASPFAMIGSDGVPVPGKPHPRLAGTFARILGHYCRDVGLFDLPTAVHKMTGMPAARFGLHDRGVIAEGKVADLVVFDPQTVIDRSTYADPLLPPDGVTFVAVAGTAVVSDGEFTGAHPGRVLEPA